MESKPDNASSTCQKEPQEFNMGVADGAPTYEELLLANFMSMTLPN